MNIDHLQTFLTICYCKNFSEAAKLLYVPQPTISNRIKHMENEMGQELFIRGKKGVTLSRGGELFLPYAQLMADTFSEAFSKVNDVSEKKEVVIGSTVPFTAPLILEKIQEIYNNKPNANLLLLNINSFDIIQTISNTHIDLAFLNKPLLLKDIETHHIYSEDLQMVISSKHPKLPEFINADEPNTMNEFIVYYQEYYEMFKSHPLMNVKFKRKFITNTFALIKELITGSNAVSFVPLSLVKFEISRGEIVHIPFKKELFTLSVPYFLIYRKNERYYEEILLKSLFKNP